MIDLPFIALYASILLVGLSLTFQGLAWLYPSEIKGFAKQSLISGILFAIWSGGAIVVILLDMNGSNPMRLIGAAIVILIGLIIAAVLTKYLFSSKFDEHNNEDKAIELIKFIIEKNPDLIKDSTNNIATVAVKIAETIETINKSLK